MLSVIFILILGITTGYLLKKKESFIKTADKLLLWSIYLLLFLLGISVGSNQTIIRNFAEIGFKAIILSLSGVAASIFLSYLVYRFFWKKNEK
ncbi:MAG: LysO family transporter [Candidatus Cloacimonadales bacterium]|nr:LysO family transporter [Candidatus Cloacimonadales bacterium]